MYQLITVSGKDADAFLQGQITQDVTQLRDDSSLAAAWCTPKGRVVSTMNLVRQDNDISLLLPSAIATTFLQRISIYVLRADVRLVPQPDWHATAVQADTDLERLACFSSLPDKEISSCRSSDALIAICIATNPLVVEVFCAPRIAQELGLQKPLAEAEWRSILIRSGSVRISANNSEKYTPHMLSLDLADAVNFDKGCYTGQEIVARTEHRGKSRRRLARYIGESASIAVGDELFDGEYAVGAVVNVSGGDVLAVTPADIHDKTLNVDGAQAKPAELPWSRPVPIRP